MLCIPISFVNVLGLDSQSVLFGVIKISRLFEGDSRRRGSGKINKILRCTIWCVAELILNGAASTKGVDS